MTGFHINGQLSLAWLPEDQVIQGVPCMAATFFTEAFGSSAAVRFHPNGNLAQCKLAESFIIDGIAFSRGKQVRFTEEGQLELEADD